MKTFYYICTHKLSGNEYPSTVEYLSRRDFEADMDKWNRLGGDTWGYRESTELKMHTVRVVRTQTIELEIGVLAATDEKAIEFMRTHAAEYNWQAAAKGECGKIASTVYSTRVVPTKVLVKS